MIDRALSGGGAASAGGEGASKKSQKRKRPAEKAPGGGYEKREQIKATQDNLERLMKKVAGGAGAGGKGGKGGKRPSRQLSPIGDGDDFDGDEDMHLGDDEPAAKQQTPPKKKKKTKAVPVGLDGRPLHPPANGTANTANTTFKKHPPKQEQKKVVDSQDSERPSKKTKVEQQSTLATSPTASPAKPLPTPPVASVALTPLQASLTTSLQSAKFRWLNEQLYTRDSKDAVGLMRGAGGDNEGVGGAFHEVSLLTIDRAVA
jgi:hypothetical protein